MAGGFQSYSTTPGSNTSINGISIAEGCAPSGINDALRQIAADGASLWVTTPTWMGTTGGTGAAYTLTPTVALAAYATGQSFRVLTNAASTSTTPTLNVSALGAKTITRWDGTPLLVGEIASGVLLDLVYDGTNFRLLTAVPAAVGGFKNALINGDFRVCQRSSPFSSPASGAYTLDRWMVIYDGTGAFTITQGVFGAAGSNVTNYLNWNQSGAVTGGTFRQLAQRIEDVHTFSGQVVTVSFTASCASGTVSVTPSFTQVFGTGGSPSSSVVTSGSAITITTTGTRFTSTITVPSIAAKTLGSTGNTDYLQFALSLPTSGTYNPSVWELQIEAGPVATAFERRPNGLEVFLCQRYYQVLTATGYLYSVAGGTVSASASYAAAPRITPTLANSATGDVNFSGASNVADTGGLHVTGTATGTGTVTIVHLISVTAEL